MSIGKPLAAVVAASAIASLCTGCLSFGKKNQEVAADAPAPPPAAYPDTSGAMAAATMGTAPATPPAAALATPQRPAPAAMAPAPFALREGEQLVPHLVQSGEYLSTIASKYNTTVGRIQSANGMTDTKIFAGKTIQVPTSAPPSGLAMAAPSPSPGAPYPGAGNPSAPSTGAYSGTYPGTTSPAPSAPVPVAPTPSAPSYPSSAGPGAISAPPVPTAAPPGYPSTTSYPRTAPAPAAGTYTTPSFDASRVQFSN